MEEQRYKILVLSGGDDVARGRKDKIICPLCQFEYIHYFGVTSYYYVKQLEDEYTMCTCPSCNKTFWHNRKRSVEMYGDDEVEFKGNVCF